MISNEVERSVINSNNLNGKKHFHSNEEVKWRDGDEQCTGREVVTYVSISILIQTPCGCKVYMPWKWNTAIPRGQWATLSATWHWLSRLSISWNVLLQPRKATKTQKRVRTFNLHTGRIESNFVWSHGELITSHPPRTWVTVHEPWWKCKIPPPFTLLFFHWCMHPKIVYLSFSHFNFTSRLILTFLFFLSFKENVHFFSYFFIYWWNSSLVLLSFSLRKLSVPSRFHL